MIRLGFKNQNDLLFMISLLAFAWSFGLAFSAGVKAISVFTTVLQFSATEVAKEPKEGVWVEETAQIVPESETNQQPKAASAPSAPAAIAPKTGANGQSQAVTAVPTNTVIAAPTRIPATKPSATPKPAPTKQADPVYKLRGQVAFGPPDCNNFVFIGGTVESFGKPTAGVSIQVTWKDPGTPPSDLYPDGAATAKTDANGSWMVKTGMKGASSNRLDFSATVVSEDGAKQFSPIVEFFIPGCRVNGSAQVNFEKQ